MSIQEQLEKVQSDLQKIEERRKELQQKEKGIALQIKQITWILLFCRYQNMSLSLICKRCNRITFCKI